MPEIHLWQSNFPSAVSWRTASLSKSYSQRLTEEQSPSPSSSYLLPPPHRSSIGQRGEAQVRLDGTQVGEQLGGLLALDAGVDNNVVTGDPVDGGGDAVLVARLERVDDAQHLGAVAARRGRVREDGADGLLGVDDEDGADGEGDALGVHVGGVLEVEPADCQNLS
jgi:hypothetical protein